MPCDSRITETKMTDAQRLAQALRDLGHEVTSETETEVEARGGLYYSRRSEKVPFSTTYTGTKILEQVGMKYAELTARAWARQKGFTVQSFDQDTQKMKLIRRG